MSKTRAYINEEEYQPLIDSAVNLVSNPMGFLSAVHQFVDAFAAHKKIQGINGDESAEEPKLINNILAYSSYSYDQVQYKNIANKLQTITEKDKKMWADIAASNSDSPKVQSLIEVLYYLKTGEDLEGGENKVSLSFKSSSTAKQLSDLENFVQGAHKISNLYGILGENFEEYYQTENMDSGLTTALDNVFSADNNAIIKNDNRLLANCGKVLHQLEKLSSAIPCVRQTLQHHNNKYKEDPVYHLVLHKAKLAEVIVSRQGLFGSEKNKNTLDSMLGKLQKATSAKAVKGLIEDACKNYQPRFPWFDKAMEFLFGKHCTGFQSEMKKLETELDTLSQASSKTSGLGS